MNAQTAVASTGLYSSFDEIESLVHAFETGTLPRSKWTHAAHVTVACWYLVCHPQSEATKRIREGILRYNASQKILTTPDSGYHETMTMFWIRMVGHYLTTATLECSLVGLINDLTFRYSDKKLPYLYYTPERLMSTEARFGFIEPDLKPLP
jgi:hypothetical protein